ncbi:hypothetical protein KUL72_04275 [Bradyrhizobium arachidis]|uniref:hypothetical protein n=1 Tax=Bradyrhizobium arachidis TaxID=858423 RepID=UPI002162756F|nr:hypothetical protein [Bradyrhizobium arachidis]UVO37614.1 hypothetical protein KUL72_04275 [Bradyrhizobium arachidis]
MAAQLSELAKRIRSSASDEKRSLDDLDRLLRAIGWFDTFSKLNLSFGPTKIGLDQVNFFHLDEKKEIDRRLKAAFKFCGLSEEDPRHWRALLNALVTECFPKKGRAISRDHGSLFELLLEIHELQAANPKLTNAEAIARKLLRSPRFAKKYPTIGEVSSLTKLVRKAQDPKHNPYARYREEKDIALAAMREQYRANGIGEEAFERGVRPVVEIAMAVGSQRAQEEDLLEHLKKKHLEIKGSACSWEAEQQYRQIAKEALERQRREAPATLPDGSASLSRRKK